MYCTSCGGVVTQGARFCGHCGVAIASISNDLSVSSQGRIANDAFVKPEADVLEDRLASKPRPWLRFFARIVDFFVWVLILGFLVGALAPQLINGLHEAIFGMIILLLAVPLQAATIAIFGNTFGKYLLGIKVIKNGKSLTFDSAVNREFQVYIKGWFFGLPILYIAALIIGYSNLSKHGITSWDESGNFVIVHKNPTVWGGIAAAAIVIIFIIISVIGSIGSY